jgi:hypothetical protein
MGSFVWGMCGASGTSKVVRMFRGLLAVLNHANGLIKFGNIYGNMQEN